MLGACRELQTFTNVWRTRYRYPHVCKWISVFLTGKQIPFHLSKIPTLNRVGGNRLQTYTGQAKHSIHMFEFTMACLRLQRAARRATWGHLRVHPFKAIRRTLHHNLILDPILKTIFKSRLQSLNQTFLKLHVGRQISLHHWSGGRPTGGTKKPKIHSFPALDNQLRSHHPRKTTKSEGGILRLHAPSHLHNLMHVEISRLLAPIR